MIVVAVFGVVGGVGVVTDVVAGVVPVVVAGALVDTAAFMLCLLLWLLSLPLIVFLFLLWMICLVWLLFSLLVVCCCGCC